MQRMSFNSEFVYVTVRERIVVLSECYAGLLAERLDVLSLFPQDLMGLVLNRHLPKVMNNRI